MPPPPASQNPKLDRYIRNLYSRIVQGKAAITNASVWLHLLIRFGSIVLLALGGVGLITESPGNLATKSGWQFWGSVISLVFGILSQIANEFQIVQRGIDSRTLAELCGSYETRLTFMVIDPEPIGTVIALFVEIQDLFGKERYNRVLPEMSTAMTFLAASKADTLIAANQDYWLPAKMQQGVVPPPPPPLPPPPPILEFTEQ